MRGYGDLFFMGAAFLLLETRSITTFALLFGTTWLVNALVFTGVLLAVLAAIEVTQRGAAGHSTAADHHLRSSRRSLVAFLVPECLAAGAAGPVRLVARDRAGVRADLLREPAVHLALQGRRQPDGGVRGEPVRRHGGRVPGVPVLVLGYQCLLVVAALLYLAAVSSGSVSSRSGQASPSPDLPPGRRQRPLRAARGGRAGLAHPDEDALRPGEPVARTATPRRDEQESGTSAGRAGRHPPRCRVHRRPRPRSSGPGAAASPRARTESFRATPPVRRCCRSSGVPLLISRWQRCPIASNRCLARPAGRLTPS